MWTLVKLTSSSPSSSSRMVSTHVTSPYRLRQRTLDEHPGRKMACGSDTLAKMVQRNGIEDMLTDLYIYIQYLFFIYTQYLYSSSVLCCGSLSVLDLLRFDSSVMWAFRGTQRLEPAFVVPAKWVAPIVIQLWSWRTGLFSLQLWRKTRQVMCLRRPKICQNQAVDRLWCLVRSIWFDFKRCSILNSEPMIFKFYWLRAE